MDNKREFVPDKKKISLLDEMTKFKQQERETQLMKNIYFTDDVTFLSSPLSRRTIITYPYFYMVGFKDFQLLVKIALKKYDARSSKFPGMFQAIQKILDDYVINVNDTTEFIEASLSKDGIEPIDGMYTPGDIFKINNRVKYPKLKREKISPFNDLSYRLRDFMKYQAILNNIIENVATNIGDYFPRLSSDDLSELAVHIIRSMTKSKNPREITFEKVYQKIRQKVAKTVAAGLRAKYPFASSNTLEKPFNEFLNIGMGSPDPISVTFPEIIQMSKNMSMQERIKLNEDNIINEFVKIDVEDSPYPDATYYWGSQRGASVYKKAKCIDKCTKNLLGTSCTCPLEYTLNADNKVVKYGKCNWSDC